jgi:hypothetical protein
LTSGKKGRTAKIIESRIESFLSANRNKAFTEQEIVHNLYILKRESFGDFILGMLNYYAVGEALKTLIKEGRVKAKVVKKPIGEETCYTIA